MAQLCIRPLVRRPCGIIGICLLSVLGSVPTAQAAGYVGLDGSAHRVENSLDEELEPGGLRFRLGMPVAPMFDVELHVGGARESQTTVADRFSAVYVGGFLKGYLPLGSWSALYALAGASAVDYTQTIAGQEFSDDRSGFSWGFGLETRLSQRLDLSADYMHYVRDDGPFTELSSVSLGLKLYF